MADKEGPSTAGEAKALAQDFLGSLGLVELVLGGVALYGMRLFYGAEITQLFPSTGTGFVDIGLLAIGAALLGRVLELFVATIMGASSWFIAERNLLGYRVRIEAALRAKGLLASSSPPVSGDRKDPVGLGCYYVIRNDSTQRDVLERLRIGITLCYSASILGVPYVIHFGRANAPRSVVFLAVFGVVILLVRGFLEQLDYFKSLAERLEVLAAS
jgi:hypothetical protein